MRTSLSKVHTPIRYNNFNAIRNLAKHFEGKVKGIECNINPQSSAEGKKQNKRMYLTLLDMNKIIVANGCIYHDIATINILVGVNVVLKKKKNQYIMVN